MTFKEIATMINSIGYPSAYYQFDPDPDNPPPAPPFICFFYDSSDDMYADNKNYQHITALVVELYTDNKDFTAESAVETALTKSGLSWTKSEDYINSERMYQITYNTGVVING